MTEHMTILGSFLGGRVPANVAVAEGEGATVVVAADAAAVERGVDAVVNTSSAARREAMRREGIPTSQQPGGQGQNANGGRVYEYATPKPGGGTKTKVVSQDPRPQGQNNRHGPHWEAGSAKKGNQRDSHGNRRYYNVDPDTGKKKTRIGY